MRRVVVTGMGAITPIGLNVEEFWKGIHAGQIGFGPITKFDASEYKAHLAAEVKGFVGKEHMDFKAAKRMELFAQYAVAAAKEAVADAGLDMEKEDAYRCGTAVGCGVGSLQAIEREYTKIVAKGPGRVNPIFVPLMISNMAAGNVSIQLGLQGKCTNDVTACATGTNNIGDAFRSIQYGEADVMVAGGTEAAVCPCAIAGFGALTALSPSDDPEKCSLPFDKNRSGFVLGEGAGIVVLEELEHAKARGAKIYAEVVGYGCSADAYHITAPREDGSGGALAMKRAFEDAGMKPSDIQYYNAHGTSTSANDTAETAMIKSVFGDDAKKLHISSTKSEIGHMVGAAGSIEAIMCIKAMQDSFVPPTINLDEPDLEHGCDLDYTPNKGVSCEINATASCSLGFGGHNGCVILKKI